MVSEACRELLLDAQRFSASYRAGLFNHLPMALLALDRLGGDEARLRAFAATYSKQLYPKRADEIARREQFKDGRIPQLDGGGVVAQAFHCLIRLAYAVDSGVAEEIPDALAAWSGRFRADPSPRERGEGGAQRRVRGASFPTFAAIAADDRFPRDFGGGSISGRIAKVLAMPPFADYGIADPALPDLALISAKIFASTGDFTALHMVTGCHAMRVLAPYLGPTAIDTFATALLAAYVTIGRPPITATLPNDLPDDATLAARAVPSDDDHDLKLVYSALREEAEYRTGWHRLCAAVRLGLA